MLVLRSIYDQLKFRRHLTYFESQILVSKFSNSVDDEKIGETFFFFCSHIKKEKDSSILNIYYSALECILQC